MSAKPALGAQRPGVPQRHPAIVGERQRHTLGLHPARLPGPERLHRALQRHLSPRSARRQPVPLTGRGPRRHRGMAGDKTSTHPRCHRSSAAAGVQKTMAATAVSRKDWNRLRGIDHTRRYRRSRPCIEERLAHEIVGHPFGQAGQVAVVIPDIAVLDDRAVRVRKSQIRCQIWKPSKMLLISHQPPPIYARSIALQPIKN